jgi:hypothetical protein
MEQSIYNNPEGIATSVFRGSGIRYAIAKWYSDRGWRVDNIYIPPDYGEKYPFFALVGKYDADGHWMSHYVGVAPTASKLELDGKKRIAESNGKFDGGYLWVITLKTKQPLVYGAEILEVHVTSKMTKWTKQRDETLQVE